MIEARDARVMIDGVTACERLSFASEGGRVVLLGDSAAVMSVLSGVPRASLRGHLDGEAAGGASGVANVASGALLVKGKSVADGSHRAVVGVALADPPLPAWSLETYVTWAARLSGASRREARDLTASALGIVGLGKVAKKMAPTASPAERRLLALAAAVATGPAVLVAEAPLRGLSGDDARAVMVGLAACLEGREAIVSVDGSSLAAPSPEGALARSASYLVALSRGAVAASGKAEDLFAAASVYALVVRSNVDAFRAEAEARGLTLSGAAPRLCASVARGSSPRLILEAARAARAALVEMTPLLGDTGATRAAPVTSEAPAE